MNNQLEFHPHEVRVFGPNLNDLKEKPTTPTHLTLELIDIRSSKHTLKILTKEKAPITFDEILSEIQNDSYIDYGFCIALTNYVLMGIIIPIENPFMCEDYNII